MPKKIAAGDPVRIADRDITAADAKIGLYYPHYRGLTGTVEKTFPDGTASLTVDLDSLPVDARARHDAGTSAMRQKWLDGLSDEARNRLSAGEKKFALRYALLVSMEDLTPLGAGASAPPSARKEMPAKAPGEPTLDMDEPAEVARKKSADLDAAEARHLAERAHKKA